MYKLAFEELPEERILYGTDAPIMLWHGKRRWTFDKYINLVREEFSWNTHEEGIEAERRYTLFIYEQMRSILDNIEELEMGETFKRKLDVYKRQSVFFPCVFRKIRTASSPRESSGTSSHCMRKV